MSFKALEAETAASADAAGAKHLDELKALGLSAVKTAAVAHLVQGAIEIVSTMMLQADAIGGQAAMDLFVSQVNESLVEMARLAAKVEAQ